jgi:hypothetical protein
VDGYVQACFAQLPGTHISRNPGCGAQGVRWGWTTRQQEHIQAGHFDLCTRRAKYFPVCFDGDRLFVIKIGSWAANCMHHVLVICRGIFRLGTIARSTGTKEGLVSGTRQAVARATRYRSQPKKGKIFLMPFRIAPASPSRRTRMLQEASAGAEILPSYAGARASWPNRRNIRLR